MPRARKCCTALVLAQSLLICGTIPGRVSAAGIAERVTFELGPSVSLPVGQPMRLYLFGPRLFASLRNGGLLVWERSAEAWAFSQFVPWPMKVSSMFDIDGVVYAVSGAGIASIEDDGQGPLSMKTRLPIAWLRSYAISDDGGIMICNGSSVYRYAKRKDGSWRLSRRWDLSEKVMFKEKEKKREVLSFVALSGTTLVAKTDWGRAIRVQLSKKSEIVKATVETTYGNPHTLLPFQGVVLIANRKGIHVAHSPQQDVTLQGTVGDLGEEDEEDEGIELDSSFKALAEMICLFSEPVQKVFARGGTVFFEHKNRLYRFPREHLRKLAAHMVSGKRLFEEDWERYSKPPKPELVLSECAGKAFSLGADGKVDAAATISPDGIRLTDLADQEREVLLPIVDPRADLMRMGQQLFLPIGRRLASFACGEGFTPAGESEEFSSPVAALSVAGERLLVGEGGRIHSCDAALKVLASVSLPKGTLVEKIRVLSNSTAAVLTNGGKGLALLRTKDMQISRQIVLPQGRITHMAVSDSKVLMLGLRPAAAKTRRRKESGWHLALDVEDLSRWDGSLRSEAVLDLPYLSGNYFPFPLGKATYLLTADTYRQYLFRVVGGEAQALDLDGGVVGAIESEGLLCLARGPYGITAHRPNDGGKLVYVGGTSSPGTSYGTLVKAGEGGRLFALHSGGMSSATYVRRPVTDSAAKKVAGKPGRTLIDDGFDVTSWDYANRRGYAAPLRIQDAPSARPGAAPPHGIIYVDSKRATATFPVPQPHAVECVATTPLPHAFGTICLQDENTLLVGGNEGMNLEWWDISNPKRSVLLARKEPSVGPPCRIKCKGNQVYVLSNIWGCGFFIYDAANRADPKKIGGITGVGTRYSDFCLLENAAIVRVRVPCGEVALVDLSKPTAPVLKTKLKLPLLEITNRPPEKPAPEGGDPAKDEFEEPSTDTKEKGKSDEETAPGHHILSAEEHLTEHGSMAMEVVGKHVFVPSAWTSEATEKHYTAVFVCELGPDSSLALVGTYETKGYVTAAKQFNGLLCLAIAGGSESESSSRLEALDISSPAKPKLLQKWECPDKEGWTGRLFVSEGRAWGRFGRDVFGLKVSKDAIEAVARIDVSPYGSAVYLEGRRLFVGHSRLGVTELDITDPSAPRVVAKTPAADGWGGALDVCDGVAYVSSEGGNIVNYQLQVVDVKDPAKPMLACLLDDYGEMTSPIKFDDRLFVIAKGGPAVLDISKDPLNPKPVRQFKEIGGGMGHGRATRVCGDRVLCCPMYGGRFGLLAKTKAGAYEVAEVVKSSGTCVSIACDDRYLYQLIGHHSAEDALPGPVLDIWDLQPSPPVMVGRMRFEGWPPGARVDHRDGYLFVWIDRHGGWGHPGYSQGPDSRGWLIIVDVRDPSKPEVVTYYPTSGLIETLGISRLDGSFLYIASYMGRNLEVVDVSDPCRPVQTAVWRSGQPFYYVGDIDIDNSHGFLTTPYSVEVLRLPLSGQAPTGQLRWRE